MPVWRIPTDDVDNLHLRIDKLSDEISKIKKQHRPTVPIYDSVALPAEAVEGQIAIIEDSLSLNTILQDHDPTTAVGLVAPSGNDLVLGNASLGQKTYIESTEVQINAGAHAFGGGTAVEGIITIEAFAGTTGYGTINLIQNSLTDSSSIVMYNSYIQMGSKNGFEVDCGIVNPGGGIFLYGDVGTLELYSLANLGVTAGNQVHIHEGTGQSAFPIVAKIGIYSGDSTHTGLAAMASFDDAGNAAAFLAGKMNFISGPSYRGATIIIGSGQDFVVVNQAGSPLLKVGNAGSSYHIKTGQAWVADL
jgi:hypothetical protein